MTDTGVRRFLELVSRELGADDVRAELGGRDPTSENLVWKMIPGGFRIVAIFDKPPEDRQAAQLRLDRMADTFAHTLSELNSPAARSATALPARRLDDALEALRARTGAVSIVVIDGQSPVLWGSSEPGHELINVDDLARIGAALAVARDRGLTLDQLALQDADALINALRKRGIERAHEELLSMLVTRDSDESSARHRLLTTLAIASVRQKMHRGEHVRSIHHEPQYGYIARGFANIYQIIAVFEGPFSELHVESAILHVLPGIEELLFALPPVDPPPSKGQVIRLRPR
ncbi:MAG TPA: hypothetical protein VFG30_12070 [Polyangiales bacterium]|jgi:hypothetical protein|nr:hypothetical protein [Polyangiales bacterium]